MNQVIVVGGRWHLVHLCASWSKVPVIIVRSDGGDALIGGLIGSLVVARERVRCRSGDGDSFELYPVYLSNNPLLLGQG